MKLSQLVTAALLTAVLCVLAPVTVPVGVIPLSAATLGVYLVAGMQKVHTATLSVAVYILLGALGVPVFAGYNAGMGLLTGITGGFLIGYVACAAVSSAIIGGKIKGWRVPLAFVAGTLVLYIIGAGWYMWQTACTITTALSVCVLPFLVWDGIKIAAATGIISLVKKHL
ncbi:MAG: biotin transporter BioY [Ruminococcaceae bacterium]|nr:biotin transporter BioY [Oscillospiraceae bacterium]